MLIPAQQNRMPLQQQRPPQYPTSGGGAKWHIPQQSSSGNSLYFIVRSKIIHTIKFEILEINLGCTICGYHRRK